MSAATNEQPFDFDDLLALYCDNQLADEQQLTWFAEQLEASEDRRREFYDYHDLHAELYWLENALTRVFSELPSESVPAAELPATAWWQRALERINTIPSVSLVLATLTMATILLSLALWVVPDWQPAAPADRAPSTEFVARISNTSQAVFDKTSDGNFQNRDLFDDDKIVLDGGLVVLTYDTGTRVVLEGPAVYHVQGANGGDLRLGKLAANVPEEAIGFFVETPFATVTDLGTEFGVEVSEAATDVAVFKGDVRMETIGSVGQKRFVRLTAGGTARADSTGKLTPGVGEAELFAIVWKFSRRTAPFESISRTPGAGLIVAEDFSYSDGLLAGNNGGISGNPPTDQWAGAWAGAGSVSGGQYLTATSSFGNRPMTTSFVGSPTVPLYFSAEFTKTGTDTAYAVWLQVSDNSTVNDDDVRIGLADGKFSLRLEAENGSETNGDFGTYTSGEQVLIVGKLEFNVSGSNDRLTVWVDPTGVETSATTNTITGGDLGWITPTHVLTGNFVLDGGQGLIDNIRIGRSWQDVAPRPDS